MTNVKCARDSSFAFFMMSLIIFIVAYSVPYWMYEPFANRASGLWAYCIRIGSNLECESYGKDSDGSIEITWRMSATASLIFKGFSLLVYCAWLCEDVSKLRSRGAGPKGKAALALAFIAGWLVLPLLIVYPVRAEDGFEQLSWCYWISWSVFFMDVFNSCVTLSTTACCFKGDTVSVAPEPIIIQQTLPVRTVVQPSKETVVRVVVDPVVVQQPQQHAPQQLVQQQLPPPLPQQQLEKPPALPAVPVPAGDDPAGPSDFSFGYKI